MPISFKAPDVIEKQLVQVRMVAEAVMRPESRYLDDNEHARPTKGRTSTPPSPARARRRPPNRPTGPMATAPMGIAVQTGPMAQATVTAALR